jgi:hypothetical protein
MAGRTTVTAIVFAVAPMIVLAALALTTGRDRGGETGSPESDFFVAYLEGALGADRV